MIVDIDVASIDNDTREKKNKIVFHLFLWKIATLYTWDRHWKNGLNNKRRYGCVSVYQFSSLTQERKIQVWDTDRWFWLLFTRKASSTFSVEKEENIQILIQPGRWACFCFFAFYCNSMHWTIGKFWIQPPRLYLLSHPQPKNNILKENYIR